MVQATKTFIDATGHKQVEKIEITGSAEAWQLGHRVYQKEAEAYCLAKNTFENGGFVVRVMTKQRVIFKIQHSPAGELQEKEEKK